MINKRSPIKTYNIIERTVKLSNKTPLHRKILFDFADNIVVSFFSEIPFIGISRFIETIELILVCKFSFVLLHFLLGEFSDQIKNDLFDDFHNGLGISDFFFAVIPIRKLNVNENPRRCSREIFVQP